MTRLTTIALAAAFFAACAFAQNSEGTDGAVHGLVFTVDANATRAIVPAAKVSLDGPAHVEAETDSDGKFALDAVPSGSYTVTAQAPGMTTQQEITVIAGKVSEIALEMKIQAVAESTTVAASSDSVDTMQSSGTNTISESTIRNMPNIDERFDSLLPLIPGVIRGPNGQINLK